MPIDKCHAQDIIDFRVAYNHEKKNTFAVQDTYSRTIYVEEIPVIQMVDFEKARVIVDKEKPPQWLNSAARRAGATIPHPQIKIEITLNENGKEKFSTITSENIGNMIGIFINGELVMAPNIMDRIDSGKALITTSYGEEEAQSLVDKINQSIKKN
jgi:preprotein translocase subunit SecD